MHPIPEEVKEKIGTISGGEKIEMSLESDLNADGLSGRQWLVCTPQRLYVVKPDNGENVVLHDVAIKDLVEVNAEGMVGSGCLIANVKGDYVPLIRYSNAVAKEFGHVARRLQAISKGEEPPATTDEDRTRRCPKCGFPLEQSSDACPNCVKASKAIRRLLAYVRPYAWQVAFATALLLVSQVLRLAPPYLTKVLLDDVLGKAEKLQRNMHAAQRHDLISLLGVVVLALIGTSVLATILGIIQSRITARMGSKAVHDIRMDLYSRLHRLTVGFFDKRQTGAVISRVSQDTSALQEFLAYDLQYMASNLISLVVIIAIVFQQNWKLASMSQDERVKATSQ